MTSGLECRGISQVFGGQHILEDIHWRLEAGDIAGLVGPSGAGKSSLLRILAGLDSCASGEVAWFTEAGATCQPRIGFVFQSLGLWPHLNALQHLDCVLQQKTRSQRRAEAERLLTTVQLPTSAWQRKPATLSGGEAQRLALARALANDPDVLLLDEPLAQLDQFLRGELLELIRSLAGGSAKTVVYVSHVWSEVARLCTRAGVLESGRMLQSGSIDDLYWRPSGSTAARLTGQTIKIPAELHETGIIDVLRQPGPWPTELLTENGNVLVRPQQLVLDQETSAAPWIVGQCRPAGTSWLLELARGDSRLSVPGDAYLQPETRVTVRIRLGIP